VVIESLTVGAVGGTKTGTPGEPFPEDIALWLITRICRTMTPLITAFSWKLRPAR